MSVPDLSTGGNTLDVTEKEIEKLKKLKFYDRLTNYDFYEIQNCIKEDGFDKTYSSLKEMKNKFNVYHLSYMSQYSHTAYSNLTSDIVPKTRVFSIVYCPKCHNNNVITQSKQTRGLDEASTDFNICQTCGNKWSKN